MKHQCCELARLCTAVVAIGCSDAPPRASEVATVSAAGRAAVPAALAGMPASVAGRSAMAAGGSGGAPAAMAAGSKSSGAGMVATSEPAAGAGAGAAGVSGAAGAVAADGVGEQALPAVADYSATGPFKTVVEPNSGPDDNYTIYRPDPLGAKGFVHSPIIFGPGIATSCAPNGSLNIYTELLTHFASHGFVTICVNSLSGGPNAPGNLTAMQAGLDWIIEQNSQPGAFEGKLAIDRAIAMGYSIGATASTQLSSHTAIMTTVSIHGHNTTGDPHGPIWLVTGTMDVIDDNRATLATLTEAPAVLSALPIGHLDVISELGRSGRYIAPLTAWLRYWVNGDEAAKHFILGPDCETCKAPWIAPEANDLWQALK